MKIIIINGPNLNLLGKRNKKIYGSVSFEDFLKQLKLDFLSVHIDYFHSNIEGEIINKLQEIDDDYDFVILNAGGYTHSSVALADCVEAISTPVIEVHLSNIYSREVFRHKSLLSPVCVGLVIGFGLDGYRMAINNIINR